MENNCPFSLKNKTIMVTGASSGIGRVTSQIISRLGAKVILVGRNRNKLQETLNTMSSLSSHKIEVFDLTEIDGIPGWMREITNRNGEPVNGLIHFAGIRETIPLRVLDLKKMNDTMSINLYSAFSLMRGCMNKSVCSHGASIVLVSSVVGQVGQAGVALYSASKGAIESAVRSSALEFVKKGIRVNAIAPGMVRSEMFDKLNEMSPQDVYEKNLENHPLGFGEPEDVAYAASYLLSDAARWVTGTTLVVDGGYTCH